MPPPIRAHSAVRCSQSRRSKRQIRDDSRVAVGVARITAALDTDLAFQDEISAWGNQEHIHKVVQRHRAALAALFPVYGPVVDSCGRLLDDVLAGRCSKIQAKLTDNDATRLQIAKLDAHRRRLVELKRESEVILEHTRRLELRRLWKWASKSIRAGLRQKHQSEHIQRYASAFSYRNESECSWLMV